MLVMKLKESLGWKEFPNIFLLAFFVCLFVILNFLTIENFCCVFFCFGEMVLIEKDLKINSNFKKRRKIEELFCPFISSSRDVIVKQSFLFGENE